MTRSPSSPSNNPTAPAGGKVRGLAHGIAAMEALLKARHACGVTQVAAALGIAPSSAHDVLAALGELGFVEKDPATHLYRVSAGAFRLVHQIAGLFGPNQKIAGLLPVIAARNNASVYIHTLVGREAVLIDAVGEYAPSTSLGVSTPAYASAAGKILVAQLPEEHWPAFAPGADAKKIMRFTDTDPDHFLATILLARENGFVISERASAIELCAIAAPIPHGAGPARYSVALVYEHHEWATKCLPDLKKVVFEVAGELARAL